MANPQLGLFTIPAVENEPMKSYAPGSPERAALQAALAEMQAQAPFHVPIVINGEQIKTGKVAQQLNPSDKSVLCTYEEADVALLNKAIDGALKARAAWEAMPFADRAAIFLKAADLLSQKYRYKVMAATMLGQGKNAWQAEIDAAAELADFWRFNAQYAQDVYKQQPIKNAPGNWNRVEYRSLEGFILAVSPFNFTAIGGNLGSAPAIMGNVVVWKPAPAAILSNYLVLEILHEAGLPKGVLQFIPGDAPTLVGAAIDSPDFAGLHFTGSTAVFKKLWKDIAMNVDKYKNYPRVVGETGGKNMHMVHKSADPRQVVLQTIRSAFEYQGQKCSACSRAYIPDNLWPEIKAGLIAEAKRIKVGPVTDFTNFVTPVINQFAFDKIKGFIEYAKAAKDAEIISGGTYDDSKGYFIQPTIIVTTNPAFKTLTDEIFGPVLTIYVYPADQFDETCALADKTSPYALTCALFATDRQALVHGANLLRHAAGNFYLNDKSTGAVVGQQPFGGSRASGTNDKAGAAMNLLRWVSARAIKENFLPLPDFLYPSNHQ
ncbi:1-pyrroline-5-carboxylate dehydrogenase [Allomyces macrogynus ATCC 38327]|nr:1-pyrroline-5-carboxylate dehydrogenase [Allomyces arbusculus]KNE72106.1 1-pyrroline-5-carboxylate dehydrogenase [Allomyces macrogynus ATCC 38327]|eukprot:KNE72106.1 1-pyrroline-5-carboxylate dehydrogenase [Allomyces macrogynus ATCC 38327]